MTLKFLETKPRFCEAQANAYTSCTYEGCGLPPNGTYAICDFLIYLVRHTNLCQTSYLSDAEDQFNSNPQLVKSDAELKWRPLPNWLTPLSGWLAVCQPAAVLDEVVEDKEDHEVLGIKMHQSL